MTASPRLQATPLPATAPTTLGVAATIWGVSLLAVGAPIVLLDLAGLPTTGWVTSLGVASVLFGLCLSVAWSPLRPFVPYLLVLLVIQPAIHASLLAGLAGPADLRFPAESPALGREMLRELAIALVLLGALAVGGYRGARSFLAVGRLTARARPVRGLFDRPISWARLGPVSAVAIAGGTLAFVVLAGSGPPSVGPILGLLPVVVVLAAINALNEEVVFRAAPLTTLRGVLGERQTVLLVVNLFAVPHYFGVPFGMVGMAMAGCFAWWVTKSALETRGIGWAWAIHFLQDVVIFAFLLGGAIGT